MIDSFQEESGPQLDTAPGVEDDRPNGVSGSSSCTAFHPAGGPKKRRHRMPKQEKDKDQQVGEHT